MAKRPTAKQLAWRKKFARMAKNGNFKKKSKRKARVSGTTTLRIPSHKKNRTVNVKRGKEGKFTSIGSITALQNVLMKKLEYKYGDLQVKLIKQTTKLGKRKVKKEISKVRASMRKVAKMKPY